MDEPIGEAVETAVAEKAPEMDLRALVREVISETLAAEREKAEPLLRNELDGERQKRGELEKKIHELMEENRRSREAAERSGREQRIRQELQRLGVGKVELAFRAVKEAVERAGDTVELGQYLKEFVNENPELLPARIAGGAGSSGVSKLSGPRPVDLDTIRPGMDREELERARQEIARVASQSLRGL